MRFFAVILFITGNSEDKKKGKIHRRMSSVKHYIQRIKEGRLKVTAK